MEKDRKPHYSLSLRLKPHIGQLLEDIAKKEGLPKNATITNALRAYAKIQGVPEREPAREDREDDNG